jgi:hypothetical protein
MKNNASSVFSAFLMHRSYCTHPETDVFDGLPKDEEPQARRFPGQSILRGTLYFSVARVGTENLKFPI